MHSIYRFLFDNLKQTYPLDEARALSLLIAEEQFGRNVANELAEINTPPSTEELCAAQRIIDRLAEKEPIQYILGWADFCNMRLIVTPNVLIPRPETEQLVTLAIQSITTENPRILDIATGSGCIAIAMANKIPGADITATDISCYALEVAQQNAQKIGVNIDFRTDDIMNTSLNQLKKTWDLIVSNPPYVKLSERQYMDENVLWYEPAEALFVPDQEPLMFYVPIARFASEKLSEGGKLWIEINCSEAVATQKLLENYGLHDIKICKDSFGKDRFVCATK